VTITRQWPLARDSAVAHRADAASRSRPRRSARRRSRVAVVVGENEQLGGDHAREARRATFERAVGPALRAGRREEGAEAFDELLVRLAEALPVKLLLQTVCPCGAAEVLLERAIPRMIRERILASGRRPGKAAVDDAARSGQPVRQVRYQGCSVDAFERAVFGSRPRRRRAPPGVGRCPGKLA
jgi:hypothetical protein